MYGGIRVEISGTAEPARFSTILSSKLGHTPLCTGVFVAEVSGTAVPARFSALLSSKFGQTPLCAGAFVAEASGTVVPADFSSIAFTCRCILECLMSRCLLPRCPFFVCDLVHTPLYTRVMEAEVSGAAVPACSLVCPRTRRCVRECLLLRRQVRLCPLVPLQFSRVRRYVLSQYGS